MVDVSDNELKQVIADFLEMGHVDNIISMFRQEPRYFAWAGELLTDDRFNVRLGLTVLFEELQKNHCPHTELAIPSLAALLTNGSSLIRGEAIGILGIIGTDKAKKLILAMRNDKNAQVREMVELALTQE